MLDTIWRYLFVGVPFLILISVVGALVYREHVVHDHLSSALQDFALVENVHALSSQELRMQQYALLAEFDPLFSFEGSDLVKLKQSIVELLEYKKLFAQYYDQEDQVTALENLYPETFLTLIPETEAARRKFVKEPSRLNARTYHRQLMRTMRAYANENETLSVFLTKENSSEVHFWNGITTPAFFAAALDTTRAEIERSIKNEQHRYACTSLLSFSCDLFAHVVLSKSLQAAQIPAPVGTIPTEITENQKILNSLLFSGTKKPTTELDVQKSNAHVITFVSDNASCAARQSRAYFMLWWNNVSTATTYESAAITLLDDIYFYDLARTEDTFSKTLYEAGLPYDLQKLNPYLCMELGYDYGKLLSAYYVWIELKDNPVFSSVPRYEIEQAPALAQKIQFLEQRVRTSNFVYVEDIDALMKLSEAFLFTHGRSFLGNLIGYTKLEKLEHVIHVWSTKSAWAEDSIARLAYMADPTIGTLKHVDIPPEVFLLTRSNPAFLYFMGNESVLPNPQPLMQIRNELSLNDFDLVTYKDTLRKQYSPDAFIQYLIYSSGITEKIMGGNIEERGTRNE